MSASIVDAFEQEVSGQRTPHVACADNSHDL
jgi:hypothetical protein